ncbi:MAG TPA: DUF3240 family protein [Gammaproteobacteria bacterium]|nr:DUF3240 family protein [Gammaproteobacteria bacterium]
MEQCVLVLIANTTVEEPLFDWLLDYSDEMVFSSQVVDCHGIEHAALSLREQVTGRQPKLQVELQVPLAEARAICTALGDAFPSAGIRYWIAPVIEAGNLGRSEAGRYDEDRDVPTENVT